MSACLPAIGDRIKLNKYIGTVKYVGEVDGTKGIWLGVDWDDPTRGKHAGTKDGKHYFHCLEATSGSFIRPSAAINYGHTFLEALSAKYIEHIHGPDAKETFILGSSNGAIEVEAVNLDKVRNKLARLERLRDVSLDDALVASADPAGEIRKKTPNLRGVDLSCNLISRWEVVASIAGELPKLESLSLNQNRFVALMDVASVRGGFSSLQELRLNRTMILWSELLLLLSELVTLRHLEFGYNNLSSLAINAMDSALRTSSLEFLNLDGNRLEQWPDIMSIFSCFPKLQHLILTSNRLSSISIEEGLFPNETVRHLGISQNGIRNWADIDALSYFFPKLEVLSITDNPIEHGHGAAHHLVIARIPSLTTLNGTTITPKGRKDSELFYLSEIVKHGPNEEPSRAKEHPQYKRLCAKYGKPDESALGKKALSSEASTLKQRLISLRIFRTDNEPPPQPASFEQFRETLQGPITIRVLPSMTLRVFRLKLMKAFGVAQPLHQLRIKLWLLIDNRTAAGLSHEDSRDLAYWGVEDDSELIIQILSS